MTFLITNFVIFVAAVLSVDWLTHIIMTRDFTNQYGWGNYNNFIKEFNKYTWSRENWTDGKSLWDRQNNCKFFASIIEFESKGMVLSSPISLWRAKKYVRKYYKETLGFSRRIKWQ
ncbi:hypothetical protein PC41400_15010 [Paenibacillus chitinolyticus]|uniref:Uncharacterized protein n=1 Tax=Paenibacillus chitinolyticus TaxID=79263 RepID=A0A410WWX0_9BACL|nr:hypothetical protein PC41400_15010 [Paenibacillus chitinolyticus]